jgi:pimeloyl-ACP methyl ester carboxylesterase
VPVGNLYGAVARLFVRLGRGSIRAPFYDARGKRRTLLIDDFGTALLLGDLDLDRNVRAELPRAIYGALHGDPAPLARLGGAAPVGAPRDPSGGVNLGLNLATNCEEWAWPFDRSAAPADRLNQGSAAARQLPAADVQPFGRMLNFVLSQVPACSFWPMTAQRPDFGSAPPPNVPVLFLHGVFDIRTPPAGTASVAAKFPQARVVSVPNTGHSTLGSDLSGCARKAVKTFLGGGAPAGCSTPADPFAPRAVVPTALKQVKPARRSHGTPGRAAAATALTVTDVFQQIDVGTGFRPNFSAKVRGGGLRGGTWHGSSKGPVLKRVVFVPGVKVSGRVPRSGIAVLRLTGKLRGSLSFRGNGTFKGTLGGKRVSGRLALTRRSPIEVAREKLNAAVFALVPKLHRRAVYPGR